MRAGADGVFSAECCLRRPCLVPSMRIWQSPWRVYLSKICAGVHPEFRQFLGSCHHEDGVNPEFKRFRDSVTTGSA